MKRNLFRGLIIGVSLFFMGTSTVLADTGLSSSIMDLPSSVIIPDSGETKKTDTSGSLIDKAPTDINKTDTSAISKQYSSIVEYALSWVDNENIPYIYGGGHDGSTLEELASDPRTGTDCSGFVSKVYAHFGIDIPTSSSTMYSGAKKIFYDQSEAVPGDVCWWEGHVALYIGNNKIVHTNTSKAPNNHIHTNILGEDYRTPSAYLRMIDDVSAFGTVTEETQQAVQNAKSSGTMVTESDLTGMPIKSTLMDEQQQIVLKGREDLSQVDQDRLEAISGSMDAEKATPGSVMYRVVAFIGLLIVVYSVFMYVCLIFDKVNSFLDISLLSIISFGRWRLVSSDDVSEGYVKAGYQKDSKVTYLTTKMLIFRAVVVSIVGFLLLSGYATNFIVYLVSLVLRY